ncbi:transmembrane protein 135 homolog isoform X1 [Neltuma alba]|uniref:transmembrane protein 135 homolog isoform X1 n=2 Tax=Neltuma alba TaxID=207710 RepID=UPI0010A351DE|nr:transmembrane protein 135 homolog isoform X1 [Prosopis alba]
MPPSGDGFSEADGCCSCCSSESNCLRYNDSGSSDVCSRSRRSDLSPSSLSSSSLLSFDSIPLKDWDKLRRIILASAKGFTIGAGLKGGLALFSILGRLRRRGTLNSPRKEAAVANREAIVLALQETLRYGFFLGSFAGTFASVDEIIVALGGHRRTARWRALLAGAIAGPSMLLTGLESQHTSLAIYILMRAAVLASRCGIKSERFGGVCKPLTWKHGDIFLMCLSSSQILSSYILKQESLPASYKSFLNKHGGKGPVILQGVKELASGLPFTNLEAIEKHYRAMGVEMQLDPDMKIPCSIVHGNQSCGEHVLSFLLQAYKRALPVYLPVYLIPALLVHRQGLLKSPNTILAKVLFGTARSSLFLSMYCSTAWMWTCLLFRIFKRCNIPMVVIGTFPAGLALAIEKKSRRIEIALYCLARAIESFFSCMADAGYVPHSRKIKRADVVVFSLSTAIIMHCYAQEREVFRSKYLNVLDWVFGVPPPPGESPRCSDNGKASGSPLGYPEFESTLESQH